MTVLLWLILVPAGALYSGIVLYMYLQQREMQYHPSHDAPAPEAAGLAGVCEERIETPDGETLAAWYAAPRPEQPVILFFHGNAGEIGTRGERFAYYQQQGFGVLFVSYRGFGASTGRVSEAGLIRDAASAHAFLLARDVVPEQIAVVGESLGSGVAVQFAAQHKIGALVLEAPYTATVDVAAGLYPWLPVRLLMKDTFKSRDFIAEVKVPLLVVHGDADPVIPVAQGRRLFAMANEPKELVILPGAGHEAIATPGVWAREAGFIRRAIPAR